MKLLALLALAGSTFAVQFRADTIPTAAFQLKGEALRDYINALGTTWKAETPKGPQRSYMAIKHTRHMPGTTFKEEVTAAQAAAIPDSFDSRKQWPNCDSIGSIRDQSQCGSCWAFGAAESMSDRICIASNGASKPTLSADDLLSCCGSYCGYGCEGGYPIRAWNWWVSNGLCTGGGFYEADGCKPYEIEPCGTHIVNNKTHYHDCSNYSPDTPRCTKKCNNGAYGKSYNDDKFFGKSAYAVRARVQDIQQEIIDHGPVEAAFTVYEDFEQYKSGVYQHRAGSVLGGHAVRILGWGTENGTPYWLVANSWNTNWGENGYFKIIRGTNDCGIEEAIVAGLPKV